MGRKRHPPVLTTAGRARNVGGHGRKCSLRFIAEQQELLERPPPEEFLRLVLDSHVTIALPQSTKKYWGL